MKTPIIRFVRFGPSRLASQTPEARAWIKANTPRGLRPEECAFPAADRADEWNARYTSMLRALGDAGLPRDVPGTPWRSPAAAAALHLARSGDAASAWRAAGYPDES